MSAALLVPRRDYWALFNMLKFQLYGSIYEFPRDNDGEILGDYETYIASKFAQFVAQQQRQGETSFAFLDVEGALDQRIRYAPLYQLHQVRQANPFPNAFPFLSGLSFWNFATVPTVPVHGGYSIIVYQHQAAGKTGKANGSDGTKLSQSHFGRPRGGNGSVESAHMVPKLGSCFVDCDGPCWRCSMGSCNSKVDLSNDLSGHRHCLPQIPFSHSLPMAPSTAAVTTSFPRGHDLDSIDTSSVDNNYDRSSVGLGSASHSPRCQCQDPSCARPYFHPHHHACRLPFSSAEASSRAISSLHQLLQEHYTTKALYHTEYYPGIDIVHRYLDTFGSGPMLRQPLPAGGQHPSRPQVLTPFLHASIPHRLFAAPGRSVDTAGAQRVEWHQLSAAPAQAKRLKRYYSDAIAASTAAAAAAAAAASHSTKPAKLSKYRWFSSSVSPDPGPGDDTNPADIPVRPKQTPAVPMVLQELLPQPVPIYFQNGPSQLSQLLPFEDPNPVPAPPHGSVGPATAGISAPTLHTRFRRNSVESVASAAFAKSTTSALPIPSSPRCCPHHPHHLDHPVLLTHPTCSGTLRLNCPGPAGLKLALFAPTPDHDLPPLLAMLPIAHFSPTPSLTPTSHQPYTPPLLPHHNHAISKHLAALHQRLFPSSNSSTQAQRHRQNSLPQPSAHPSSQQTHLTSTTLSLPHPLATSTHSPSPTPSPIPAPSSSFFSLFRPFALRRRQPIPTVVALNPASIPVPDGAPAFAIANPAVNWAQALRPCCRDATRRCPRTVRDHRTSPRGYCSTVAALAFCARSSEQCYGEDGECHADPTTIPSLPPPLPPLLLRSPPAIPSSQSAPILSIHPTQDEKNDCGASARIGSHTHPSLGPVAAPASSLNLHFSQLSPNVPPAAKDKRKRRGLSFSGIKSKFFTSSKAGPLTDSPSQNGLGVTLDRFGPNPDLETNPGAVTVQESTLNPDHPPARTHLPHHESWTIHSLYQLPPPPPLDITSVYPDPAGSASPSVCSTPMWTPALTSALSPSQPSLITCISTTGIVTTTQTTTKPHHLPLFTPPRQQSPVASTAQAEAKRDYRPTASSTTFTPGFHDPNCTHCTSVNPNGTQFDVALPQVLFSYQLIPAIFLVPDPQRLSWLLLRHQQLQDQMEAETRQRGQCQEEKSSEAVSTNLEAPLRDQLNAVHHINHLYGHGDELENWLVRRANKSNSLGPPSQQTSGQAQPVGPAQLSNSSQFTNPLQSSTQISSSTECSPVQHQQVNAALSPRNQDGPSLDGPTPTNASCPSSPLLSPITLSVAPHGPHSSPYPGPGALHCPRCMLQFFGVNNGLQCPQLQKHMASLYPPSSQHPSPAALPSSFQAVMAAGLLAPKTNPLVSISTRQALPGLLDEIRTSTRHLAELYQTHLALHMMEDAVTQDFLSFDRVPPLGHHSPFSGSISGPIPSWSAANSYPATTPVLSLTQLAPRPHQPLASSQSQSQSTLSQSQHPSPCFQTPLHPSSVDSARTPWASLLPLQPPVTSKRLVAVAHPTSASTSTATTTTLPVPATIRYLPFISNQPSRNRRLPLNRHPRPAEPELGLSLEVGPVRTTVTATLSADIPMDEGIMPSVAVEPSSQDGLRARHGHLHHRSSSMGATSFASYTLSSQQSQQDSTPAVSQIDMVVSMSMPSKHLVSSVVFPVLSSGGDATSSNGHWEHEMLSTAAAEARTVTGLGTVGSQGDAAGMTHPGLCSSSGTVPATTVVAIDEEDFYRFSASAMSELDARYSDAWFTRPSLALALAPQEAPDSGASMLSASGPTWGATTSGSAATTTAGGTLDPIRPWTNAKYRQHDTTSCHSSHCGLKAAAFMNAGAPTGAPTGFHTPNLHSELEIRLSQSHCDSEHRSNSVSPTADLSISTPDLDVFFTPARRESLGQLDSCPSQNTNPRVVTGCAQPPEPLLPSQSLVPLGPPLPFLFPSSPNSVVVPLQGCCSNRANDTASMTPAPPNASPGSVPVPTPLVYPLNSSASLLSPEPVRTLFRSRGLSKQEPWSMLYSSSQSLFRSNLLQIEHIVDHHLTLSDFWADDQN